MGTPANIPPARKRWLYSLLALCIVMFGVLSWHAYQRLNLPQSQIPGTQQSEIGSSVNEIALEGPASSADAEISGMAWYEDWLVLLPQYPSRFEGHIFALAENEIVTYLDEPGSAALSPQLVAIDTDELEQLVPGFEGFESIAFIGDLAYLTIEANHIGKMHGYIVRGQVNLGETPFQLQLDSSSLVEIELQASLSNYSDESIVVFENRIHSIYEANGANVNPQAQVHLFSTDLDAVGTMPIIPIEYRITDATLADSEGRFWAINYLFPGDLGKLRPAIDEINSKSVESPNGPVERLLPLRITAQGIVRDENRPLINLALLPNGEARNWEGIAQLEGRGILVATDKFPRTILAFVAIEQP